MNELFEELADNAPVMIWRSGPDMLCDYFNRPWLEFSGKSFDGELGMGWTAGIHLDDFERCLAIYTSAFGQRTGFSMEYRLLRHGGQYRWLLDNGKPFERDGEFAGYFGSCVDITDRRNAEDNTGTLVSELNHRVKNVLAAVQSFATESFKRATGLDDARERLSRRCGFIADPRTLG